MTILDLHKLTNNYPELNVCVFLPAEPSSSESDSPLVHLLLFGFTPFFFFDFAFFRASASFNFPGPSNDKISSMSLWVLSVVCTPVSAH